MPFADYLHDAVARPLGLTTLELTGSPGAGAVASLNDVLAFGRELLAPTLITGTTLAEATQVAFPGLSGVVPGYGRQDPNDWGLGFERRGRKTPHWTGSRNSEDTFGHFGRSGTFLWVDPGIDLACAALDRSGVRIVGDRGVARLLRRGDRPVRRGISDLAWGHGHWVRPTAAGHQVRPRPSRRPRGPVPFPGSRARRPGHRARAPGGVRPARGRGLRPPRSPRRSAGQPVRPRHRIGHHARGLAGRVPPLRRGRMGLGAVRPRPRRGRVPVARGDRDAGAVDLGQHVVLVVPAAHPGRHRDAHRLGRRGARGLPPEADLGRVDGDDEPHRGRRRLRRRRPAGQGVPGRRRHLADQGPEDLHHLRRARPGRQHRPSRAGAHAGRRSGHPGDLLLHRAQVRGRTGRLARGSQRRQVRVDRAQARHPRQPDVRDGVRRRW